MADRAAYSLLELNQYIRRVISLNFDQPIWIECEIGQASQSRGHWYLDLIQKDGETITAQCQAAMWANMYFFLRKKSPIPPEDILKQGMSVKLKVNVDYHERYGLKLIIEDIDSSFTIGQLEIQRQAILKALKERDLIRKNAEVHMPSVIQRLAVISSDRAAGYKDFIKHIEENLYSYDIEITLYESAMQGQQVENDIISCLKEIEEESDYFDAVAIIRGGGARTDLAAFDNLNLAVRIANYPIPVLIGIGHEIDQSVLDLVAYRSLKTPTAVADYVVNHNCNFETRLEQLLQTIEDEAYDRVQLEKQKLLEWQHALKFAITSRIRYEISKLDHIQNILMAGIRNKIKMDENKLSFMQQLLSALDPDVVLKRGFSITTHNNKTITSSQQLQEGDIIETIFFDGKKTSTVQ